MNKIKTVKKCKTVDQILNGIWEKQTYGIYIEIDSYDNFNEKEMAHLLSIGLESYEENDYATPTGISNCIVDLIMEHEDDKDFNLFKLTIEDVNKKWDNSERY